MDRDTLEKLLLLTLGWLLGLLGPVIVDAIKRRRENTLGRSAIYAELRDVAHKLTLAAHYIYMHKGKVDRPHLEWTKRHLEGYAGLVDMENLLKSIRLQLTWPDEQLTAYAQATAAAAGKSVVLQKYPVPLLDSRVSALWTFDTTIQRHLLDVRSRIELLNDIVDRSRKYSDMTFTKLENNNYDLVVQNVEQCYTLYAESAKQIADHVKELRLLP